MGEGLIVRRGGSGGKPEGNFVWKKYGLVGELPKGYTELEYLAADGNQYIDIGFVPNQNTRIVVRFRDGGDPTAGFIFGAETTWLSNAFSAHTGTVCYNTTRYDYSKNSEIRTIDLNKNVLSIDGVQLKTFTAANFNSGLTLSLFAVHRSTGYEEKLKGDILECQVYDNGTLVRNLKACMTSDGTLGYYDKVNNVLYTNQGTGSFTFGADSTEFLDYVVSDDPTAYPDGGMQDGYWYEKVSEITGIDYGEVTLTSAAAEITINHNLKVKPKYCLLLPKGGGVTLKSNTTFGFMQHSPLANNASGTALQIIKLVYTSALSIQTEPSLGSFTSDEYTVKFPAHGTSQKWGVGRYQWVVIA